MKAFRDTWRDGIHSYLSYLRDRLTVARDLLTESGSVFVQIGDENVHRVRALMDEVFGGDNLVNTIAFKRRAQHSLLESVFDSIFFGTAKNSRERLKVADICIWSERSPKRKQNSNPSFRYDEIWRRLQVVC